MQLSFLAKKYFNIPTICPPHPQDDKDLWSSLKAWEYGTGPKASSWGSVVPERIFLGDRTAILHQCIKNGWKLLMFNQ